MKIVLCKDPSIIAALQHKLGDAYFVVASTEGTKPIEAYDL